MAVALGTLRESALEPSGDLPLPAELSHCNSSPGKLDIASLHVLSPSEAVDRQDHANAAYYRAPNRERKSGRIAGQVRIQQPRNQRPGTYHEIIRRILTTWKMHLREAASRLSSGPLTAKLAPDEGGNVEVEAGCGTRAVVRDWRSRVGLCSAEARCGFCEPRVYTALPGKRDALAKRFADRTAAIYARHGITNVGYWIPQQSDPELGISAENTFIYIRGYLPRLSGTNASPLRMPTPSSPKS